MTGNPDAGSCRTSDCDGTPWNLDGCRENTWPPELQGLCWDCAYWNETAAKRPDGMFVALHNGEPRTYQHFPEQPAGSRHLGFAGRRYTVRYLDGREVTTNDLWAGSPVPARHAALFPVDAEIISAEEG